MKRSQISRDDYDSKEDYDDAVRALALSRKKKTVVATQGSGEMSIPEPIVFDTTIYQWMRQYDSVTEPCDAEIFWTIGDIRTHLFGLVPFGNVSDPLSRIKDILESEGFYPVANPAFSSPVYQLKKREIEKELTSEGEIKSIDDGLSLF